MGQKRILLIVAVCILIALAAFLILLMKAPVADPPESESEVFYIAEHDWKDITYISVQNEFGFYDVTQEGGGFKVYDLPSDLVNGDYLKLLLDESSKIAAKELVTENLADLALYGLDSPRATVTIAYSDKSELTLLLGSEERVSDGVYFMIQGSDMVYLMPRSYSIRFTMAVEGFIQYQITPTKYVESPLSIIRDITFAGASLPEPIVIEFVDEDNEQEMRDAYSFGVSTHLIRSPGLHELDQDSGSKVFQSLLGIVSEGIVAYNCTEETLNAYGFNRPDLTVDFTIVNGPQGAKPEEYHLSVVQDPKLGPLLTCNDNRVIYRILDVAFTKVKYEELTMRWFLTPFITDLKSLKVTTVDQNYEFTFEGDTNKDLAVFLDGKQLDMEQFRSYYRLLVSASRDGIDRVTKAPGKGSLLTIVYNYKDTKKPKDTLNLYPGDLRRVSVEVNGITEFAMKEAYLTRVQEAGPKLLSGEPIEENW